jgi:epoxyqueuosine reductase
VERRRSDKELVRAGEIAPVVSDDPGRHAGRHSAVKDVRRPRLLSEPAAIRSALAEQARARGFDAFGVAKPDAAPELKARLESFLADGAHGDMTWLASTAGRRASPLALWPDVRSIVMLGMNYGQDTDPLAILSAHDRAAISIYARGDDYHDLIKTRLKELARWLTANAGGDVKVFVDTAAVMEKPLAASGGLGWQGKHTNLVSRQFGSWLFLGSIFTTLDLPADSPEPDSCGTCRACLDICPTAAFPAPYKLDARRCISYLTIEHKGPIPRELRTAIGNRIYGCDDCLAVCPWNKFASQGREAKLAARDALRAPRLADLARLDDAQFRTLFSKTSIKRTGRDRFVRNVLIAIGNSGDATLVDEAARLLDDASPLVRGAAVWALSRLLQRENFAALARRHSDPDKTVREEWAAALG